MEPFNSYSSRSTPFWTFRNVNISTNIMLDDYKGIVKKPYKRSYRDVSHNQARCQIIQRRLDGLVQLVR